MYRQVKEKLRMSYEVCKCIATFSTVSAGKSASDCTHDMRAICSKKTDKTKKNQLVGGDEIEF